METYFRDAVVIIRQAISGKENNLTSIKKKNTFFLLQKVF